MIKSLNEETLGKLNGYSNRMKVTLDHTKITDDLVDFPLMIPLAYGLPTEPIIKHLIEVPTPLTINFSESAPGVDTKYWSYGSSQDSTFSVDNIGINLTRWRHTVSGAALVYGRVVLVGDFVVELDFTNLVATSGWQILYLEVINCFFGSSQTNSGVFQARAGYTSSKVFEGAGSITGWLTSLSTVSAARVNDYGSLRLTRVGSSITTAYRDGTGSWVSLAATTVNAAPMTVNVGMYCTTAGGSGTITQVRYVSGTLYRRIENLPNLFTAGIDGNYLDSTITPSYGNRSDLFIRIPKIYKDFDTSFYIYYDKDKPTVPTTSTRRRSTFDLDVTYMGLGNDPNVMNDYGQHAVGVNSQNVSDRWNPGFMLNNGYKTSATANKSELLADPRHLSKQVTLEVVIKRHTFSGSDWEFLFGQPSIVNGGYNTKCLRLIGTDALDGTKKRVVFYIGDSQNPPISSTVVSTTYLSLNQEYYIVGTYDGAFLKMYINGVLEASVASTRVVAYTAQPMQIASESYENGTTTGFAKVTTYMARHSKVCRSAAWIKANYDAMQRNLLTFGPAETL